MLDGELNISKGSELGNCRKFEDESKDKVSPRESICALAKQLLVEVTFPVLVEPVPPQAIASVQRRSSNDGELVVVGAEGSTVPVIGTSLPDGRGWGKDRLAVPKMVCRRSEKDRCKSCSVNLDLGWKLSVTG